VTSFRDRNAALDPAYLDVLRPYRAHARNAQDETYCIKDIGFSTSVETGDGVEAFVPSADDRPHGVGFKTVDDDLHDGDSEVGRRLARSSFESDALCFHGDLSSALPGESFLRTRSRDNASLLQTLIDSVLLIQSAPL
jgi:hypothetical protein